MILGIDQGTTGSRAIVFDQTGRVVSRAYREFRQYYPKPGWVEHDPDEIMAGVYRVIGQAVRGQASWGKIDAIGITNQRETFVIWDSRTGRPLHRAIVWQCRRTADLCAKLKKRGMEAEVRRKTGLVLDPYFSGTKVRWLLDNVPGLRTKVMRGGACFGTMDSWVLWNLTNGVHATDYTNASRTLMFDIRRKRWDAGLIRMLGIAPDLRLPKVLPSAGTFGETRGGNGIPRGVPISGICGDQQAALFGQNAVRPGDIKNTYGTGCFLMLHTGSKMILSRRGLLTTLACDERGRPAYALEGAVFIAGALIQWLRDGLKIVKTSPESETLARSVADSGGVAIVPAFAGLGAPHWRPEVRGAIFGLTRGSGRAELVRAALEAIAYQTADVLEAMRADYRGIRRLRVDGGASRNDLLMQIQADVLGMPVVRPSQTEMTAWGAAKMAGIGSGLWPVRSQAGKTSGENIFKPSASRQAEVERYRRWKSFVECLL